MKLKSYNVYLLLKSMKYTFKKKKKVPQQKSKPENPKIFLNNPGIHPGPKSNQDPSLFES